MTDSEVRRQVEAKKHQKIHISSSGSAAAESQEPCTADAQKKKIAATNHNRWMTKQERTKQINVMDDLSTTGRLRLSKHINK